MVTVPPLTSIGLNGQPYKRRAEVEQEISRVLALPPAEWESLAAPGPKRGLSSEALVFLIRSVRNTDRDLAGRLILQLNRRTLRTTKKWCGGFDRLTTEGILVRVEQKVIDLLLASEPTRSTEYLEIAFASKVKQYALNEVAKIEERTVVPATSLPLDPEAEDLERSHERVRDEAPNPEELLRTLRDPTRREQCLDRAFAAICDPRHREAVRLHYLHDWPISAQDPSTPSLARSFGMSPRQIQNWINTGLKDMLSVLKEES